MTQDIPDDIYTILAYFELGILLVVPTFAILYTWTERARPHGVSLSHCAERVCRRFWVCALEITLLAGAAWMLLHIKYAEQIAALLPLPSALIWRAVASLAYLGAWYYGAQSALVEDAPNRSGGNGFIKGALVIEGSEQQQRHAEWRANLKPNQIPNTVRLAGVYMPRESETLHTLVVGASGSGKTIAIQGMVSDIAERAQHTHERALVLDPDGNYLARYFDKTRGDLLWNPWDARSVRLALLKEVREPWDAESIAAALVPEADGPAKEWADMARVMTQSALEVLSSTGAESRDIYDLLNVAAVDEQRELLAKTPAVKFFEDGAEKTRASMGVTLMTATAALRHLPRGDAFSVKDWIRNGKGWLFLPYTANQIDAARPLFRALTRIAIFEALTLPAKDNGLWFIIDEFDALGRIEGLQDAMVRMRKHGGRMLLGLQTIAMIERLYGRGASDAIAENAGNRLLMRSSSGQEGRGTNKWASHLIGQREVRRIVHSSNTSSGTGWHRGGESSNRSASSSSSEQIVKEDAVMPAEFEQLGKGKGFLKFASQPEWLRVTCPYINPPESTPAYLPIATSEDVNA